MLLKLDAADVMKQLSEPFTTDDASTFGPRSALDVDHDQMVAHSKESLSFDGVYSSITLVSLKSGFSRTTK